MAIQIIKEGEVLNNTQPGTHYLVLGGTILNARIGSNIDQVYGGEVKIMHDGAIVRNVGHDGIVGKVKDGAIVWNVNSGGTVNIVDIGGRVNNVRYLGVVIKVNGYVRSVLYGGSILNNQNQEYTEYRDLEGKS